MISMAHQRKRLARFYREFEPAGYTLRIGGSGHFKIFSPDGRYVTTVSATPSDPRGARNAVALLRRHDRGRRKPAHV
jgi:hypothetical protein